MLLIRFMIWYAIHVKPKCEVKATNYFEKLGVKSFVPLISKPFKKNNKVKHLLKPLINGYVFFKVTELDFKLINANPFTRSIVLNYGKPAIIQDEEIQILKDYLTPSTENKSSFQVGMNVRVENGVFAGRDAQIIEHRSENVILILKDLQIKITLSLANNKLLTA